MHDLQESLQQLEHSLQENANLKHSVSPGAFYCSGPRTYGKFGANTSGDDCTPHRAGKDTKSSGGPGLSTANTFIPCGLAISSCGLTSISAIAATAFDMGKSRNVPNSAISLKQTFNRNFVTGNILEYKKQKTGIGEQSSIVQP